MKFSTAILTKVALSFFVLQGATALPASTTNELSTTTITNAGLAQLVARSLAEAAFEREDIEANFIKKIWDKIFKKDKPKPIEQKPLHQIQNEMWKPHKPQPGDIKFTPRSVEPDLEIAHLMTRSLVNALGDVDEDVQANIFKTIINLFKKDKPKPIEQKPLHQIQNEMWKPHKPQPGDIKFTPRSADPDLEIAHLMARSLAGALSEDEDVQANIFKTIVNFFKKDKPKPKPIEQKPLHEIQNEMWKPHKPQPGDLKFRPKLD